MTDPSGPDYPVSVAATATGTPPRGPAPRRAHAVAHVALLRPARAGLSLPSGAVRPLVALLCLLGLMLSGCGRQDEAASGGSSAAPTAAAEDPATTTTEPAVAGCKPVQVPAPREEGGQRRPRKLLPRGQEHDVTVRTNCGDFTIRLDTESAPRTAASFVALARSGFYDNTTFHRIVPGFVIQGGDPKGDGTGGPGYKTVDRPPDDVRYTKGLVAMAKTEPEAPGTAGSQFFVVTAEDAELPPDYAVLGRVTEGLDVVERIGTLGDRSQQPTQTVVVEGMSVRAS